MRSVLLPLRPANPNLHHMCCCICRANPLAEELLQLLTRESGDGSSGAARRRIDALLSELQGLEGLQFDEQLLQGGPWRVS